MLLKNGLLVAPNQVPETATPASAADTCHPSYSILIPIFVMVNIPGSSKLGISDWQGSGEMCCTSRISPSPLDFTIMWKLTHRQDFPILVVMKKLLCFLGLGKKIYDLQQKTHTYSLSCFFYLTNLIVTFVCDLLLKLTMTAPALKGSMNVLRACTKSPSVKRVVMTSSCSAIRYDYNRSEKDPPLDETVWSNIEYCREYKV